MPFRQLKMLKISGCTTHLFQVLHVQVVLKLAATYLGLDMVSFSSCLHDQLQTFFCCVIVGFFPSVVV